MTPVFTKIAAVVLAIFITIMAVLFFLVAIDTTPFNIWFSVGVLSMFAGISWGACFAVLSEAH